MTSKVDYTHWIERFLSNELDPAQKKEFEKELKNNHELVEELRLNVEIHDALTENDVLSLRENLNAILNPGQSRPEKIKASFDLIEDLEDFVELESQVDTDELLDYYESLPKLHIYQHEIAQKENVHHFYKEQELTKAKAQEEEKFFNEEFDSDIEDAIMEKDIVQLRDNLNQIAKSIPEHEYGFDEVDSYVNGTMPANERAEFEKELKISPKLAVDVNLHKEIEKAVTEADVISLMANLGNIMKTQASYNQAFVDIERYLEKSLSMEKLAEFENDMFENMDLKADVELHKEVELAGAEQDVISLKDNLEAVESEISTREEKSIIKMNTNVRPMFIRYSAAVVILIAFGLSIFMRLQPSSDKEIYNKYAVDEELIGVTRSSDNLDLTLTCGKELFQQQHYEQAATFFQAVIDRDNNNSIPQFFLANSYQNMQKALEAIEEYKKVVSNSESTYKELAEYNIGLCYLIRNDKSSAVSQFRRIANSDSFYSTDAAAIIRELKLGK